MFFDHKLLYKRHNGRLGLAWTAATRGVSQLKKKDVIEFSLESSCNELLSYIISNSASANQRFSLRLSAILVTGIIRIYSQQVKLLYEEICRILIAVVKPNVISQEASEDYSPPEQESSTANSFPTPLPVIKTKKRQRKPTDKDDNDEEWVLKVSVLDPRDILTPLEMPVSSPQILPAARDDITLRETNLGPQPEQGLDQDFGFGPIPDTEGDWISELTTRRFPPEIPKDPESEPRFPQLSQSTSEDMSPQVIVEVAQVHVSASSRSPKRLKPTQAIKSPGLPPNRPIDLIEPDISSVEHREKPIAKRRKTAKQVSDIEGIEVMPEPDNRMPESTRRGPILSPPVQPVLAESQVDEPNEEEARSGKIKKDDKKEKMKHFVARRHLSRFVKINSLVNMDNTYHNQSYSKFENGENGENIVSPANVHPKKFTFELLLHLYYMREILRDDPMDQETPVKRSLEVAIGNESVTVPAIVVTPPERNIVSRPSIEVPLSHSTIYETIAENGMEGINRHEAQLRELELSKEILEDVLIPTTPRESRELTTITQPTGEQLIIPFEEERQSVEIPTTVSVTEESPEFLIEKRKTTAKKEVPQEVKIRRQNLAAKILEYDENAEIPFDDLIPPPPTKMNAAKTFSDLLAESALKRHK